MDLPMHGTQGPGVDQPSKSPNGKSSTENSLKTSASVSTDKLKNREKLLNLRKFRDRPYCSKPLTNPVEPIVLSSEEEHEDELENAEILPLPTIQDRMTDDEETKLSSKPPLPGKLTSQTGGEKPEQPMSEDEHLRNNTMELASLHSEEKISHVLEIQFNNVYIGKRKGRSRGCAKFSKTSIEIPLKEFIRDMVNLSVDCCHLKKCGMWMNIGELSVRNNDFIFLWISEDYIAKIQKALGHPVSYKSLPADQFFFLELCRPLTDSEQAELRGLIKQWSMTNKQPELIDLLSWKEAVVLLQDLSMNECSFLSNCNITFPQEKKTLVDATHKPQETNENIIKPCYTVLRKRCGNNYDVSLSPIPGGEWKKIGTKGSVQKLIVYPPPPTKGGLGVTQEDLECLEHGEFLNDVIIDFYLKYLLHEKVPQHLGERSHVFSSFFFKCLTRPENTVTDENPDTSLAQRRHHRVKTWTRHVDIFKKDFIFVPVNEEAHWYLAVICFPSLEKAVYEERQQSAKQPQPKIDAAEQADLSRKGTVIVFNDASNRKEEIEDTSSSQSEGNDKHTSSGVSRAPKVPKGPLDNQSGKSRVCKRPCILIFDSLKAGSVQNTVQVLREYLEVEWNVKRKSSREFSRSSMRDFCPRVPKQDNSSDCGVYLLQYVESFFQSPIVSFEPPMHMEHWFPRHVVRSKREGIRDLILGLHLQQKSGSSS